MARFRPPPKRTPEEQADFDAQKKANEAAREKATREHRWKRIIRATGERYANCRIADLERYDDVQAAVLTQAQAFSDDLPARVQAGQSLVMFGPVGTGKDHIAAALMRAAVLRDGMEIVWKNGMDLYGDIRDGIGEEKSESAAIRELVNPAVLVISDPIPPLGDVTSFQAQVLYRIIDRRYRNCKPTWLTMNVTNGAEAAKRMGAAVIDRLRDHGLILECKWASFRARNTTKACGPGLETQK